MIPDQPLTRSGKPLEILNTINASLPDDTYLTALAIRQRMVTFSGRSGSAAQLIPLLAAEPRLRRAGFSSPVTRGQGPDAVKGDSFTVSAEFVPG